VRTWGAPPPRDRSAWQQRVLGGDGGGERRVECILVAS